MKLSFSTLGCPEWSLPDIISTAKDFGYDGIEIRGVKNELRAPKIREFLPENAQDTKKQLVAKGLEIACLTSACYLHKKETIDQTILEAKEYIDTAADLGVAYIRVLGDTDPAPKDVIDDAVVASALAVIAEYGAKKGVMPLIETNGCYADTKRLQKLLQGIPNTGVIWDIHHPYRFFNEAPEETMKNIGANIRLVHIKDSAISGGKIKYAMLGYGDIPVKKCVSLLKGAGYKGFYSLEWVKRWDLSLEEPGIAFAQYAGFMRSLK
jgi:sugar phosphate isomerase/epimerase